MTAIEFWKKHKKEMMWGMAFGLVCAFIGESLVKILEFINMIANYIFEGIIWIIRLPLYIVTALHLTGNQIVLIISAIAVGAFLGIIVKPVWDFLWKLLKKSPV